MENQIFSVKGKVIIITGGQGLLGREFAHHLNEQGAKVAIFDIVNYENTRLDAKFISDNYLVMHVDVTNKKSIQDGLSQVELKWGVPHGLINCAAIDFPPDRDSHRFEDYPEEQWDKVMEVNVKGTFLCCQVIGATMMEQHGGSIINIGSIYGMVSPDQRIYEIKEDPFIKPISYSVSKSAILNLTRYLATYWGKWNVRVNTMTFGGVLNNQNTKFYKNYINKVPLERMASKDEYNGAIQFLLSDASSYMTGANLVIDGGWTAW